MNETILFFSNDKILEQKIQKVIRPFHVELKPIALSDYNQPLGALAGLDSRIPLLAPYHGAPFEGPMLLFAGISKNKLEKLLVAFRTKQLSLPYKAMLTPTNRSWTAIRCFEEIKREHELLHP